MVPADPVPSRLNRGCSFAVVHWGLLVLAQIANARAVDLGGADTMRLLLHGQREHAVAALFVGLFAWGFGGSRAGRWVWMISFVILTAAVFFDRLVFGMFFDHVRPSLAAGAGDVDLLAVAKSLLLRADVSFCVEAALSTALLVWLALGGGFRARFAWMWLVVFAVVFAGIGGFFPPSGPAELSRHPLNESLTEAIASLR